MHKSILKLFFISTSCIYFFSIQSADEQKPLTVITTDKKKITLPYSVWYQLPLLADMVEIYETEEPLPVQLSAANLQRIIFFLKEGKTFKGCDGKVLDVLNFLAFQENRERLIAFYYIAWLKNNPRAPVLSEATAEAILNQMDIKTKMQDLDFIVRLDPEDLAKINQQGRTSALTLVGDEAKRSSENPITVFYGEPNNTFRTIVRHFEPGTNPLFLGHFDSLITLVLSSSHLTQFPLTPTNIPHLTFLDLSNNNFQCFPLHRHPTLRYLLLENNKIKICREPLNFPQLTTCDLKGNPIEPKNLRGKVKECPDTATFTFTKPSIPLTVAALKRQAWK